MQEISELLKLLLNTEYGEYIFYVFLAARVFVTVAPVKVTMHIPDTIMMIISAMALASNKKADNKGNPM